MKSKTTEEIITTGLTEEEVASRMQEGLVNVQPAKGQKSVGHIIFSHTVTYFNLLNLALAILVLLTGQIKNALFIGTALSNTLIGIVQELKVKSLIDKLQVITATKVSALRGGETVQVSVNDIVKDDVIYLSPGDQIVTDGSVFHCHGFEVNESMLTGESKPVKKADGDKVLSGSFVSAGTAVMQVEKVGQDCYAAQLVSKAAHKKRAQSQMQRSIGRIIKVVSVVLIPIGLLLFPSQLAAQGGDVNAAILRTVSAVIGMIPEGLVLLTSVSFILGVGRLARKQALVQEMAAIESLARADILCTDKTGTITTGELRVEEVIEFGEIDKETIGEIIAHINGAFEDANATQAAVDKFFGRKTDWQVRETIPFSSARKYKAAAFDDIGDFVIGAPEFLIPDNKKALRLINKYSQQGYRVLLLGYSSGICAEKDDKGRIDPMAAIVISDIIKEDAKDVFAYFANAGVAVKVLSGDNPITVSTVALKAGVAGAEKFVDASTLPEETAELAREIAKYNVFGRVKPEQKQAFVKAWQEAGKTVAMVGDGVNDVLAIKDANCGIAMAAGSEAAKQAAHIVLLDSDFASMKEIVSEGRTIIANIERVSALYLTKTIYACILSVLFIFLRTTYPFTTLQMGFINLFGIGAPSFLLTLEKQEDVASEGFLSHVLKVSLPFALTMVSTLLIVQVLNFFFPWEEEIFSTFNLLLGGFVSLLAVAEVSQPLKGSRYRTFVVALCAGIFLAGILFLPRFYDIHSIFMWWSLLLIPLAVLIVMMVYLYSRLTNKFIVRALRARR
ncbi:MAG: HAD-IC family P-type ATPase [Lachnospiraceae bacterium]|nr:HAD-IC family P-type ATPase [Lachnospiraceae bacterium]